MRDLKLFWNKLKKRSPLKASEKKKRWLWYILFFLLFVVLYVFSALSSLRIFIPYYFQLSGFPFGSRTYLIVFQNNHELRPSGGFVSNYGLLSFRGGIPKLEMSDVYGDISDHGYIKPPYPMEELLANEWYKGYTFRDANYDPNFPETAKELMRMYHITRPKQNFDGVIAINYSFLEDLVGALGEIQVNGKTFTKDNLFAALEYEVNNIDRHNIEEIKNRKSILKPFAGALFKKIALSPLHLRKVCDTVISSLANKEIQLFFEDSSLQKLAQVRGWSGNWPEKPSGDFLAVNEANLGGMKSDRYIERNVTYHLTVEKSPAENVLTADVKIDLYHFGIENIPISGPYTGFIRTYVPKGAKLLEIDPKYKKDLWQDDDGHFHIFGNIVHLNPGERTTLHYRYTLPSTVLSDNDYYLYIPKQSGTEKDYYTVIIEANRGLSIQSNIFSAKENIGIFKSELNADFQLDLKLLPDKIPPQVVYQDVEDLKNLLIVFNEDIDDEQAVDPSNYQVKDSDEKHPEKTDNLTIDRVERSGKAVRIFVKGMTRQHGEYYQLTLQNISDKSGNVMEPSPRTITLVQR
jgi:hypothetical protein